MCGAEQLPGQLCACFISVVVFTEEDELPGPARVFALWLPPPAAEVGQTGVSGVKGRETSTFVPEARETADSAEQVALLSDSSCHARLTWSRAARRKGKPHFLVFILVLLITY